MIDKEKKYEILKNCEFFGDIFNIYKKYTKLDIQNPNLKIKFFEFIEELLSDGVITLCDYREDPAKTLTGTPKEQVDELRKIWPTMEEMQLYFPDDPWYYVEWFWWRATCPIELECLPRIEIYQTT